MGGVDKNGCGSPPRRGIASCYHWSIVRGQRDFTAIPRRPICCARLPAANTSICVHEGTTVSDSGYRKHIAPWPRGRTGGFNGDGKGDILWRRGSGNVRDWLMKRRDGHLVLGVGNVPLTLVGSRERRLHGRKGPTPLARTTSGNKGIYMANERARGVSSSAGVRQTIDRCGGVGKRRLQLPTAERHFSAPKQAAITSSGS